jgi:hypothetical protein
VKLHHYTCDHGMRGITTDGYTRPNPHPLLPGTPAVTWLTDLDIADREALGLTSRYLRCDRTRHRLTVDSTSLPALMHWPIAARAWRLPLPVRGQLETGGALPMHWWIATEPIDTACASLSTDTEPERCTGLRARPAITTR